MYSAASCSFVPPISPIITTLSVFGSLWNLCNISMNVTPETGSPPIPTQVDWPIFRAVNWFTASYVSVPLRDTTPVVPLMWMCPGIIPILKFSPGEIMPGQLGPTRVTSLSRIYLTTFIVS